MRVVYLNPVGEVGGAELSLLDLMASVAELIPGVERHLIVAGNGPLIAKAKALGVTVHPLPLPEMLATLGDFALRDQGRLDKIRALLMRSVPISVTVREYTGRLRALLRELDPTIVHSNGIKTHILLKLSGFNEAPVIWHIRDFYGSRPLVARVLRWTSRGVSRAIAISAAVGRDAEAVLKGVPVTVVYNAIDTVQFAPKAGDGAWLDDLAGHPAALEGTVRVGLVATYARWKGQDLFMRAIRGVQSVRPARFYIVGGPIYKTKGSQFSDAELRDLAGELGVADRVAFVPFQTETADVFRALDVVIHASTQPEPFGRTIVEAMACSRPVVVANAGGASELYTEGKDALGVTPRNSAALAWAMDRLIDNETERRAIGECARATALTRYARGRLGRDIADVYAQITAPPMRITFLSPVGVVGGAERVLLAAIRGARKHLPGARLDVVLFAGGPLEAEVHRLGAVATVVPLPDSLAGLGDTGLRGNGRLPTLAQLAFGLTALGEAREVFEFVRRLRAALRWSAPDVIHSNGLKAHAFAAVARPRGVPVLWHLHDLLSQRPVMARLLWWLSGGVAGGIAISEAVRRDAEAVLPRLAISLVRNAVDTDHFAPADRDGAELDRLAGMGPAEPGLVRVGLVATYANWKGQDVFLDALARLPATGPPVRGYVVGGPIYATAGSQFTRDELEQRAAANGLAGRVGFIPFQADPADVYRMLDVAVHASIRSEPFGLTIVEAMGCGKPVVVSAAGGAAELFLPEYDGLGHAPGDATGLAVAVARLAANPALRARLGTNARRTAVERFSHERYGREMAAIYLGVGSKHLAERSRL
jgi:glycosyltransferase involved in cell wall biosynthesis